MKKLKINKPLILTVVSVAGVGLTTASAIVATNKYKEDGDVVHFVPTFFLGAGTIISIIGNHKLSKQREASLLGACGLLDNCYKSYQAKVVEKCGEDTHKKILDELTVLSSNEEIIYTEDCCGISSLDFADTDEKQNLYFDEMSRRYFKSTHSRVLQAEYHLNRNYMLRGEATLNEFYRLLGIPTTPGGDDIGWNNFNGDLYWIDFDHHKVPFMLDTNKGEIDCYLIDYIWEPTYEMLHEELK